MLKSPIHTLTYHFDSALNFKMTDQTPYREIRASFDSQTITLYQAYSPNIAIPAVENQKLNASKSFSVTRMTWVKPSWNWMMYRSGYSYKDERQTRILAIKMTHESFQGLLRRAVLTYENGASKTKEVEGETEIEASGRGDKSRERENGTKLDKGSKSPDVKVQWDPERTVRLERLPYRSIQIGIPGALVSEWVEEWIVGIEDVTEKARRLKKTLDEDQRVTVEGLLKGGLIPEERVYELPDDLKSLLAMKTIND